MKSTRRRFFRTASLTAGGAFFAPLLRQLHAQAAGQKLPPRFVFVVEGNGLEWRQVTPLGFPKRSEVTAGGGRTPTSGGIDASLVGKDLPEALQPVKEFQEQLTVVNGLSGKVAGGGHSSDFGALGVYNCGSGVGSSGQPKGETVDVALGKHLGGVFPHVGLGISDRPEHDVIYNSSAWGAAQPMPTICQPMTAYGHLFGSVGGGASKAEFNAKSNLLDFLIEDVKRLEREVPAAEKEKLGAHLGGYEEMRQRQSRLGAIEGTLRKAAPDIGDKFRSEVECDRLDAHFDLAAASLIGGLTNAVTIASGVGNPYFSVKFTGLGIDFGKHGIGHGGSYNGMTAEQMKVKIRKFHFEMIAGLMRKLQAVPEGDGTMLDNTCIVYLSDAAEGHHSRCREWPMVLLPGKSTGIKGGRYLEVPVYGESGHREIGNLYTTLLHAAGDQRAYFGQHDAMLKGDAAGDGPLEQLLV
ncbi:MAG: DUF1552 domain-containing protein [Verrucomicrobiales bacterium]